MVPPAKEDIMVITADMVGSGLVMLRFLFDAMRAASRAV